MTTPPTPETETRQPPLAKTYTPSETEPAAWRKWVEADAFHAEPDRVLRGEAKPYCVLIPPPNVTAALHLGHALNNTIQDILTRAHRMKGYEALWMPGTDHAGIATQTMVDKRLREEGKPALAEHRKMEAEGRGGREKFVAEVQAFKDEYERRITEQLQAMGCSCDWERQRFTMDPVCARAVREAFFRLFKEDLIYRGKRLVNWDPVTQTALADDEVEMEEVDGAFYDLRYPLVHPGTPEDNSPVTWGELAARGYPGAESHPDDEQAWVTVATTRPETYLGDVAVAMNPKDPRAAALRGLCCRLPIVGRVIPLIEDDYVVLPVAFGGPEGDAKAQMSTGFLKVTPAHDPNDYELGRRHEAAIVEKCSAKTTLINVMAPDASISDKHGWTDVGDAHLFVGLTREQARERVVAEFKARSVAEGQEGSLLERVRPHRHSVGHSYRSHAVIEPYLSDQWYCRVTDDRLRGNAQRALRLDQRSEQSLAAWPESAPDCSYGGTGFQPVSPPSTSSTSTTIPGSLTIHRRHLPHLQRGGSTYFVTFRVRAGQLSPAERDTVMDACFHFHNDRAVVRLVTVMPDHVHMLITPLERTEGNWWSLQDLMHSIKSFTANSINQFRGATGSLWQDEYFDRAIRDADEFIEKWNYMVLNPVRAGLSEKPGEYAWVRRGEVSLTRDDGLEARPTRGEDDGLEARPTEDNTDATMTFHPARYAKNYEFWHDNLRDWCISRQLWWGHRIPVWRRQSPPVPLGYGVQPIHSGQHGSLPTQFSFLTEAEYQYVHHYEYESTHQGVSTTTIEVCIAPNDLGLEQRFEANGFTQDPDVLDTWFSSALWPLSTMGWPDPEAAARDTGIEDFTKLLKAFNPTSVLTTAREIITLWVSRMVMFNRYFLTNSKSGLEKPGPAPFKDVFIHAMIQDGEGRKMSKSLGNGVDPLDIIETHGADAMRFTLCQMTTQTQDVRMPVERDPKTGKNTSPKFDIGRNLCNKLWNAARFALTMLERHPVRAAGASDLPIDPQHLSLADRWMLSRLTAATGAIDNALRHYQFKDYADAVYDLLWRDFCDWYLESIKPTLATDPNQPAVLRLVLDAILRLMHPVTPFITEALHERVAALPMREVEGFAFAATKSDATLCQSGWPQPDGTLRDEVAEAAFDRVRALVTAVREVRAARQVPPKRQITLHATKELAADVARWSPLVETLAGVGRVTADPAPANSAAIAFEGAEHRLADLADAADSGAERERLLGELAGVEKSIAALEGRLANPGYTAKAPAHLVQQTRDELAAKQRDAAALRKAIEDLG